MEVLRSLRVVAQLQQRGLAAAVSHYIGNLFPFSEQQRCVLLLLWFSSHPGILRDNVPKISIESGRLSAARV
jgi:hypothetical protein